MKRDGRRPGSVSRLATVAILLAGLAACSGSQERETPPPVDGPLSILLVNDDGWDAPGITAVAKALTAAGHRVTLVAPLENQSGKSMSTSVTKLSVTRPTAGAAVYAVDGTPVDAVNVGLFGVLADDPPDLVVSGVNLGANVADNTNYSGTVGAAAAAAEAGFPAIAVSGDTDAAGEADFGDASRIVVDLVAGLAERGFDGLGRSGFVNVNVPAETSSRSKPRGVRVVPLGVGGPRTVEYAQSGPTTWTPRFAYDPRVGRSSADAEQLADGWTTVTWLPSARTAPTAGQDRLERLVDALPK